MEQERNRREGRVTKHFWSRLDTLLKTVTRTPAFYFLFKQLANMVIYYRGPRHNERIVELPFVFESLEGIPKGARILDVGVTGSILPMELAALGYDVFGVDLVDYPGKHPNFAFVRAEIGKAPFPDGSFDVVTCVSTLEHIGLYGFLYPAIDVQQGDRKAMSEIRRIARTGGKIVVTVPFGSAFTTANYRVYNGERLRRTIGELRIQELRTYVYKGDKWIRCGEEEASRVRSYPGIIATACLRLVK